MQISELDRQVKWLLYVYENEFSFKMYLYIYIFFRTPAVRTCYSFLLILFLKLVFASVVGVCNTDNFSLLSITIDYGPFGFMENYDAGEIQMLYMI